MSRVVFSYALSGLLHVSGLTLAWLCGATISRIELPEFEAVRGEAVTLVAAVAMPIETAFEAEVAQRKPSPVPVTHAVKLATARRAPAPQPVPVAKSDRKLPALPIRQAPEVQSENAMPPSDLLVKTTTKVIDRTLRLESAAAQVPPRKAPALVQVVQQRVATSFQGAELDRLPRKLPHNLPPEYPEPARLAGQQGRVVLRVSIDASGSVEQASVLQSTGYPALDTAALEAVRVWRFQPAMSAGRPVAAVVNVPLNFIIRR